MKNKIIFAMSLLMTIVLASCGYLIQPNIKKTMVELKKGSYQIDPSHTTVLFKISHMGFSTFVGRFNKFDAQLEFDPANIGAAKLSAVIDMASIDVNNPDFEETLRGSSWLDSGRYAQAIFKTNNVKVIDASTAEFIGDLTFRGVSAPVTLSIKFNGGGNNLLTGSYTLGFSADTHLLRSTYGMDYLVPAISDRVDIEIYSEFKQK